jgi:hypothetical protein
MKGDSLIIAFVITLFAAFLVALWMFCQFVILEGAKC